MSHDTGIVASDSGESEKPPTRMGLRPRTLLLCLLGGFLLVATGAVTFLQGVWNPSVPPSPLHLSSEAAAAPAPARERPARGVEVVEVLENQKVRSAPGVGNDIVARLAARRPWTSVRTTLPVLRHDIDVWGFPWVKVLLPGRIMHGADPPRAGWIPSLGLRRASLPWRIKVSIPDRTVKVYRHGREVRSWSAVVGAPSTPTPVGSFFVEEVVPLDPGHPGNPFGLALSARSEIYRVFGNSPGQIAIHGMNDVGGAPGTAVSHGCVRVPTQAIMWLARRIGPGVPVLITG